MVKEGQKLSEVLKNNSPIFEKETKTTEVLFQPPIDPGSAFVWNVQATDKLGKPYGANGGIGEVSIFSIITEKIIKHEPVPVYSLSVEYPNEVVNVTDTLSFQIDNNYSSGSNKLSYTITNLTNNQVSPLTKLGTKNNQGLIRIHLPLQNSGVARGETGLLTLTDYKKYYYISFKRN